MSGFHGNICNSMTPTLRRSARRATCRGPIGTARQGYGMAKLNPGLNEINCNCVKANYPTKPLGIVVGGM